MSSSGLASEARLSFWPESNEHKLPSFARLGSVGICPYVDRATT